MKTNLMLILAVPLLAGMAFGQDCQRGSCCQKEQPSENPMPMKHSMSKSDHEAHAMVALPTIQCGICESTIESALSKSPGILSFDVDVEGKIAHINYDSELTSQAKIELAISMIGYQANKLLADAEAYAGLPNCCKVSG